MARPDIYELLEAFTAAHDWARPEVAIANYDAVQGGQVLAEYLESRVLRAASLTQGGFRVISSLALAGPLEPHDIAAIMYVSTATVATVLNTLQAAGLVKREPHPTDGRKVIASLTERGEEAWAATWAAYHRAQIEVFQGWTREEMATLSRLTRRLRNTIVGQQ